MSNKFHQNHLEGDKGKLMLEISKTFKGDSRFKLDQKFQKDVDVEQMPQKFKQKLEQDLLQRVKEKTKHIKKQQPPLIIRRFQPGTKQAEVIERKAEGKKQYIDNVLKSEKKKMKKQKVEKGINKIQKADQLLRHEKPASRPSNTFKMEVKGNRQEAFKPSEFKLFE